MKLVLKLLIKKNTSTWWNGGQNNIKLLLNKN